MTIIQDILSNFHPAGKQTVYGFKGEKVTLISVHGDVLIVEGKKGRFSVLKSQIIE